MKMVTISQAKGRLSALIDAARNGEEILILRGSRPAVTLRPVSEGDLALVPEIPASSLDDFDREIEADRRAGRLRKLGGSTGEAAANLAKRKRRG